MRNPLSLDIYRELQHPWNHHQNKTMKGLVSDMTLLIISPRADGMILNWFAKCAVQSLFISETMERKYVFLT